MRVWFSTNKWFLLTEKYKLSLILIIKLFSSLLSRKDILYLLNVSNKLIPLLTIWLVNIFEYSLILMLHKQGKPFLNYKHKNIKIDILSKLCFKEFNDKNLLLNKIFSTRRYMLNEQEIIPKII